MADYTTVELVGSALGVTSTDEATLANSVTAASRLVDGFCGRNFDSATKTWDFEPSSWNYCRVDDLVSITTLKTDDAYDGTFGTTWSTSDYITEPANGVGPNGQTGWPITGLCTVGTRWFPMWGVYRRQTVRIIGTFGWAAVPDAVKQAALFLAEEMFKAAREAPYGTAGGLGEFGVTVRGNARVADLLAPYKTVTASGGSFLVA